MYPHFDTPYYNIGMLTFYRFDNLGQIRPFGDDKGRNIIYSGAADDHKYLSKLEAHLEPSKDTLTNIQRYFHNSPARRALQPQMVFCWTSIVKLQVIETRSAHLYQDFTILTISDLGFKNDRLLPGVELDQGKILVARDWWERQTNPLKFMVTTGHLGPVFMGNRWSQVKLLLIEQVDERDPVLHRRVQMVQGRFDLDEWDKGNPERRLIALV